MEFVLEQLSSLIISFIDETGYVGIFVLMALEGSFIPVPSEIILPFSGYLVFEGRFSLLMVAFVGALGNIVGTLFTYSISRYVGLSFLHKYGKYVLVTRGDIDLAQRLFEKYGAPIIFVTRLIPGIRGFIAIPAGVARMKIVPFVAYVFTGSFIYSLALTYLGVIAGKNWDTLGPYFRKFDWVVVVLLVVGVVWWIWRHVRNLKYETNI